MVLTDKPRVKSSRVTAPKPVDLPSTTKKNNGSSTSISLVSGGQSGWRSFKPVTDAFSLLPTTASGANAKSPGVKQSNEDAVLDRPHGDLKLSSVSAEVTKAEDDSKPLSSVSWAEIDEDEPFQSSLVPLSPAFGGLQPSTASAKSRHEEAKLDGNSQPRYFAPIRPLANLGAPEAPNAWTRSSTNPVIIQRPFPIAKPVAVLRRSPENTPAALVAASEDFQPATLPPKVTEKAKVPDWIQESGVKPIRILRRQSQPLQGEGTDESYASNQDQDLDKSDVAESSLAVKSESSIKDLTEAEKGDAMHEKRISKDFKTRVKSETRDKKEKNRKQTSTLDKPLKHKPLLATLKIVKSVPAVISGRKLDSSKPALSSANTVKSSHASNNSFNVLLQFTTSSHSRSSSSCSSNAQPAEEKGKVDASLAKDFAKGQSRRSKGKGSKPAAPNSTRNSSSGAKSTDHAPKPHLGNAGTRLTGDAAIKKREGKTVSKAKEEVKSVPADFKRSSNSLAPGNSDLQRKGERQVRNFKSQASLKKSEATLNKDSGTAQNGDGPAKSAPVEKTVILRQTLSSQTVKIVRVIKKV